MVMGPRPTATPLHPAATVGRPVGAAVRYRLRSTLTEATQAPPHGDQGVEREWRARCPAHLGAALFSDSAPGERLQFAFYDLADALVPDGSGAEPRPAATALLAAGMAAHRPDLEPPVAAWLAPELRTLLTDVVNDPGPGRPCAPTGSRPCSKAQASTA
ncbi:hypothetical protein [Spirillospora sp. NBC_01491]|uniref:hypothetical protein n=1 Tax=Spirillospora sp. NBC_01491 TaxID=2976007 RepID=UPI002E366F67|nr:hypothetical protein [Spirillospora sp. NBC_01491]